MEALLKTSKGRYVASAPIEDGRVMNGMIEACLVAGANRGQPLGTVMLNAEAALRALDPTQRQAMEQQLKALLDALNARFDPHGQLDCRVVADSARTVDNGCTTPTFKLKRNRIEAEFAPCSEGWVKQPRPVVGHDRPG